MPNPERALDSLRNELQKIEATLAEAETREQGIATELEMLEQKVKLQDELVRLERSQARQMRDSVLVLNAEITSGEILLWDLAANLEEFSAREQDVSQSLARAVLADHRLGAWAALELIAGSASWKELTARRALVRRLRTRQSETYISLVRTRDSLSSVESQVSERTLTLDGQRKVLAARISEASTRERQLQMDEKAFEREKRALRKQLKKTQGSRESLLARQKEIEDAKSAVENLVSRIAQGEPVTGVPLQLLKGHLPWPAEGQIVERFGMVRNEQLQTTTENPGIELATTSDAYVSCVAEGKVSSVTWLRGFGNVCIIEHPGTFYTVYARLNGVSVNANDQVAAGTALGQAAYDPATEQYRIHFELWQGREKKNPLEWLQAH